MAYNEKTTILDIYRLVGGAFKDNDVFRIGKKGVAKAFLQSLLELSSETGYEEVEAAYRASTWKKDLPEDSDAFWKFIEKDYLELEIEPRAKFVELAFQVTEDLAKIAANLKFIAKERAVLEEKKRQDGRLSADERYYRNQLDYFENKNVVARDEVVDFMANGIKSHAIRKSAMNSTIAMPLAFFYNDNPYAFGSALMWAIRDPYDVRSLDEYSNKFTDLPITGHRKVIKECRESYDKFREYALAYITGIPDELPSVREKLDKLVGKSHILARRKKIIESLLRHFDSGDYISFVSIAPLQIEGIFADICREIGVSESKLDISSLNDKLDHIEGKIKSFHYFEYYAFKFPVLRNLVAHGGLVDGDVEKTALHLMLDLMPVCELTVSEELPINHALNILEEAENNNYNKLIEWLDLREKVDIPGFYEVDERVSAVEQLYKTPEFWAYLEGELKKVKEVDLIKGSLPLKVAGKIKRSELANEQADEFLKSSWRIANQAITERNEMIEKFRKHLNLPSGE